MGAGASVPVETEMDVFKEMQKKFEELKAEGKSDEDIYSQLKVIYSTAETKAADSSGKASAGGMLTATGEAAPPLDVNSGTEASADPAIPLTIEAEKPVEGEVNDIQTGQDNSETVAKNPPAQVEAAA